MESLSSLKPVSRLLACAEQREPVRLPAESPPAMLPPIARQVRPLVSAVRSSASGSVWSFGDGSNGALGLAAPSSWATGDAYEPTRVPCLPSRVSSVAAGHYHSLAVDADGQLWAWGRNDEAQLGRPPHAPRDTWSMPERVLGLDHVRVHAASASGVVSAAIGDDGSLWVWGRSKRGQLGLGKGVTEALRPSKVEALAGHEIAKVSFGWGHALALTTDGKLFGWGYSENGRVGQMGHALESSSTLPLYSDGSMKKASSSMLELAERLVAEKIEKENNMPITWEPSIVQELSHLKVSDVACGLDHSLVLCCDGMLLSCGDNTYGQLGRVTEGQDMLPITTDFKLVSISAGLGHSLAVCRLSSAEAEEEVTGVISWGWNCSSQLGRWGIEDIPTLVEGLEGERPVSVSAGRVHSIALTSKGEVWTWGSGRNGRLGLGSSSDEAEPALVETLDGMGVLQAIAGFDHNLLLVAE